MMPSPQRCRWQSGRQEVLGSVELPGPWSHCSAHSTKPLPQVSVERQSELQPSHESRLLSSQASPHSVNPLPQLSFERQLALHPSQASVLPSSQVSRHSTRALPQVSVEPQSALHPSQETVLPSSHASAPMRRPSPQRTAVQRVRTQKAVAVSGSVQAVPSSRSLHAATWPSVTHRAPSGAQTVPAGQSRSPHCVERGLKTPGEHERRTDDGKAESLAESSCHGRPSEGTRAY
jgi:hypothetical protein